MTCSTDGTVGLTLITISVGSLCFHLGSGHTANAFCSLMRNVPCVPSSSFHIKPREPVMNMLFKGILPSCEVNRDAAPKFAEPEPKKTIVSLRTFFRRSVSFGYLSFSAPKMPATVTAAVPWISSLYVRKVFLVRSKSGNASFELKSSN